MNNRLPRRSEFLFDMMGVPHVAVARENNDGEAIAYVYVHKEGDPGEPFVVLVPFEGREDVREHVFGELDLHGNRYRAVREAAWKTALTDAEMQAQLLGELD